MTGAAATLVIVDGSNVARCSAWRARCANAAAEHADDVELRGRLVDAICSWAPQAGVEAHVVFDGAGPWRAGKIRATADVIVIGSGRADGDDVVERRASNAHRDLRTYWLVTSDRTLQQVAGARAERVIDADAFVAELGTVAPGADGGAAAAAAAAAGPPRAASSQLGADIPDDVRARLERMRRGLDPDG